MLTLDERGGLAHMLLFRGAHQLQGLVEESIALAVQVGIGAACFGHTDPGKTGLL